MRLSTAVFYSLGLAQVAVAADTKKYSQSLQLTYEIVGTGKQHQLAEVLYEPSTLKSHLASWTPPSTDDLKSTSIEGTSAPLVRVSLPGGSSTVTGLSSFDPSLSQYIDLWLSSGPEPTILSANISPITPPPLSEEEARQRRKEERARARGKPVPSPKPKPKKKAKNPTAKKPGRDTENPVPGGPVVQVNLKRANTVPKPQLFTRPPPKVDNEGREILPEEVPEKTFFQKYWWVFMVATVLIMSGGGGDGK